MTDTVTDGELIEVIAVDHHHEDPARTIRYFTAYEITVDGRTTQRDAGVNRQMFNLYDDGQGLARAGWSYRHGPPIDEALYLKTGIIEPVSE